MLRHNFLLIYRNFKKFKSTFFINLIGLSTGLACTLLIFLWVNDELSVDKFHENDARLYQVMKNLEDHQGIRTGEHAPGLLGRALVEEMPEVESAVSVFPPPMFPLTGVLSLDDNHLKARWQFADKDFFNVFSYPLLWGNKDQVLSESSSVVISEALAINLFQSVDNAAGKTVAWKGERNEGQFLVSGVFETLPSNASIQFDIVFNYDLLLEKFPSFSEWGSSGPSTYILLKEGADVSAFNGKIANFVKSKYPDAPSTLFTRPYSDRYLYSEYENGVLTGGRIEYVRLFSIIAVFILLIACINFTNLSTAKASQRLKEIGVKKAIGADRKTLLVQYLGESMLLAFLSSVVAVVLVLLFLPQFNIITGKVLALHFDKNMMLSVLGITLLTGFIAGSYPAVYLSGFDPIAILKGGGIIGKSRSSTGELWARKGLVVFQFSVSILLVVSVLVVYQQMKFVQAKNLGFDRDNVVTFTAEGKLAQDPETFLSEIKRRMPGIVNASYMDGDLVGMHNGTTGVGWEGKDPDHIVDFEMLKTGYDLVQTLGIALKEGRSFDRGFSAESSKVLFNEAAIESMGLTDPVGKTVTVWGEEKEIIGVVENFHFESLYEQINPFFFMFSDRANNIMVKIKAGATQETLAQLEKFYQEYNMGPPLEYRFLDEDYQVLYMAEQRVATLSKYFASLAILISCLGLFGLAAFTAERRIKEIGIRKVLGASEWKIMKLLSSDFARMVLAAIVVALPLSYYLTKNWLDGFAYKIDLEWWYFAGAGALTMLIALLTVSFQSVKAALANPVESLRSE